MITSVAASQTLPAKPLSEDERRIVLDYLIELQATRATILQLKADQIKEDLRDARDRESWQKALDAERRVTAAVEKERDVVIKERDLAIEKAKLYEDLYNVVRHKKGGFGCFFRKLFTLWRYQC